MRQSSSEGDFGCLIQLFAAFGIVQWFGIVPVAKQAGQQDGGEALAVFVVFLYQIVVSLTGIGDAVFGGDQFFAQLLHVG